MTTSRLFPAEESAIAQAGRPEMSKLWPLGPDMAHRGIDSGPKLQVYFSTYLS
jgi:hypothetical protein